ncbi:HAD-like domain-containing protein [Cladorrhinum sp. PSN332]|nr:HAD-like domain-containing protein [Cladorrhinum sp. PSN332]
MPSAISTPPTVEARDFAPIPTATTPKRKIIIFSDFDGTISMQDTGHLLFDSPYGRGERRRTLLDEQIKSGERTFKDASEEMYASLNVPFDDGFELMSGQLTLDPGFQTFHKFCLRNQIPFHVISAGLKPVLRKVLDEFLGEEESATINVVANEVEVSKGGKWKAVWKDGESEMGHDKAKSIKREVVNSQQQRQQQQDGDGGGDQVPLIVFIGDGVSDLPAAREADVLFARKGLRLEGYCVEHGIKYVPFDSFADVQRSLEGVMKEDEEKTGGKGKPVRFNPRANMWRRMSSQRGVERCVVMSPTQEERMFLWPETFTQLKVPGEAAMGKVVV